MIEKDNNFQVNTDFEILIDDGNIGFYESCEVTEIFLYDKKNKKSFNLFTLCVFEEIPYDGSGEKFLTEKLIKIDKNYKFGIKRYSVSIEKIKEKFNCIKDKNEWFSIDSHDNLACNTLRFIPKQFIPSNNRRLNNVLKNNFHSGSYILEFFDENKSIFDFFMNNEKIKQDLFNKIKDHIPIRLSTISDRLGNFIFQFPVTLVEIESNALPTWNGINFKFFWNLKTQSKPNCLFQIESILDDNYMNQIIERYNGNSNQEIIVDNFQKGTIQTVKFLRKDPNLILTISDNGYIEEIRINSSLSVGYPEPRIFKNNGEYVKFYLKSVEAHHFLSNRKSLNSKNEYHEYIIHKKNYIEKEKLEKNLDFKEYFENEGIEDLQRLIRENSKNGVYLWDPFLEPEDIIHTLFYSKYDGVELRALCNKTDRIREYKDFFDNELESNKMGLNLEFRIRNGCGHHFHDRFLIFPGNLERFENPKVYSLGTSVNSYCYKKRFNKKKLNYYILQKVLYPQPIIDAFNKLWNQLDSLECLIWKHPE